MINKKLKMKVFRRDKWRCLICGDKKHLTIDHIIPKSKGGIDHIENLQTLCEKHNHKKGNQNQKDYRKQRGLKSMNPYLGSSEMIKKNFLD